MESIDCTIYDFIVYYSSDIQTDKIYPYVYVLTYNLIKQFLPTNYTDCFEKKNFIYFMTFRCEELKRTTQLNFIEFEHSQTVLLHLKFMFEFNKTHRNDRNFNSILSRYS